MVIVIYETHGNDYEHHVFSAVFKAMPASRM
jgi:hypothetical protein